MALNKNDKGLTLIELLVTIAVIAIVAAISVPVITNVVGSANANAALQTASDINDFIVDGSKSGQVHWNGTDTFELYVDLNGDNLVTANEKISDLVIDTTKFTIMGLNANIAGLAPDTQYTSGGTALPGVTGTATVTVAGGGNTGGNNNASGNITYLAGPTTGWTVGFGQMSILTSPTFDFIALQANPTAYQIVIEGGSLAGTYQFQNLGGANMDTLVTATFSQNLASDGMFPQDSVQISWGSSSPLTSLVMSDPSSMGMGINGTSWFNPGSNVGVVSIQLK